MKAVLIAVAKELTLMGKRLHKPKKSPIYAIQGLLMDCEGLQY